MQILELPLKTGHGATLTACLQPVGGEFQTLARRPAILVLPGGGYQMCSDREADPVALAYLKAGFQAFVLRYAIGAQATWPNPLTDYECAAALIRSHAEDWHLYPDKLAVIGFSAGGHLAACAAAMARERPDAAILGYPVIDAPTVQTYLPGAPDAAAAVDAGTCPCFVFAGRNDDTVPVTNTLAWLEALTRYDISYECHIYSQAGHGFSTGEPFLGGQGLCSRVPHWVEDSVAWLRDVFGEFANRTMTPPRCPAHVNGNREAAYNLDCTLQYLLDSPAASVIRPVLQPLLDRMHLSAPPRSVYGMTFRRLAGLIGLPAEQLAALEAALHAVPKEPAREEESC